MKHIRQKPFDWLTERYASDRILVLVGARQVGKSTLMQQFKEDRTQKGDATFYITLEQSSYKELLDKNPDNLFQIIGTLPTTGRVSVIIDEIQYLKDPTHTLKYLYDSYKDRLKIIVTGSSSFYINEKFKDSLAGRKYIYEMNSLSFKEFLQFKNFEADSVGDSLVQKNTLMPFFYEYMLYGGYPSVVLTDSLELKKEILNELAESYTKKDILDYQVSSQENYLRILKLCSQQIGNLLNINTISNQLDIPRSTVERYLHIMEKSFHITLVKPYFNNKKKEIKKMPKLYFCDTGLRNLFANNFEPFEIRIDKGMLLENTAYLALRTEFSSDDITFWRDTYSNEVDFIIKDTDAFEVKAQKNNIDMTKYKTFSLQYPNIPLSVIDAGDSITLFLKERSI